MIYHFYLDKDLVIQAIEGFDEDQNDIPSSDEELSDTGDFMYIGPLYSSEDEIDDLITFIQASVNCTLIILNKKAESISKKTLINSKSNKDIN